MSKLIQLVHPFEIDTVKTIGDFLIILKNVLRLASLNGVSIKKDGVLIPVRWSSTSNSYVVDRGTDLQRDIVGITLENVNDYFYKSQHEIINKACKFAINVCNSKSVKEELQKYNLKKNENKFIAFEYCNNKTNVIENKGEFLYPIGLFQRCQTKKRSGIYNKNKNSVLIDSSDTFLNCISNSSEYIQVNNKIKIKNYYSLYEKFISILKNKNFTLKVKESKDINISFKEDLNYNLKINKSYKQEDIVYMINNSAKNIEYYLKYKSTLLIYLIYFEFTNFFKKMLELKKDEEIEGFVVEDKVNNIFYKITGDFILKNTTKKETVLLKPLLPIVF